MKDVRQKAAMLLLERGICYKINDAPFLLKILRLNKLTIKSLRPGTIALNSIIIFEKKLDENVDNNIYLLRNIDTITRIIANSILNSSFKIPLFSKVLSKLLKWGIEYSILIEIYLIIQELNTVADFTNITSFYTNLTAMMMNVKLGQENGS